MHTADRQEIVTSFAVAMTILDLLLAPHRSGARLDEILDELLQHDTAREAQAVRGRYLRTLKALGWHLQTSEPLGKIQVSRHQKQVLYLLHFSQSELEALYFHLHLVPYMLGDDTWSPHLRMAMQKVSLYLGDALYDQQVLSSMFTPWQKGYKTYGAVETHHRLLALLHAMIVLSPSQITRYFFHHLIKLRDVYSTYGRTLFALTAEACADYLAQHPHCIIGDTTYAMLKAFTNNSA